MEIGKIGMPYDTQFDAMFAGEGVFGRSAGDIDPSLSPAVAASLYAPRIRKLFEDAGFGDFEVAVDGSDIDFMAFNANGSNVRLGMRADDALELIVDWTSGVSVQNGNEIDLDWWFEGRDQKFDDVADLKRFVDHFKDW